MNRKASSYSQEVQDTLRALRRAAKNALALGIKTGTPVYVMKNNKLVDLTKGQTRGSKSRLRRASPKAKS